MCGMESFTIQQVSNLRYDNLFLFLFLFFYNWPNDDPYKRSKLVARQ